MKNLYYKTKNIIDKKSGETLIESILSILLFAILMLAVTGLLTSALQITKRSTQTAKEMQEITVNEAIIGKSGTTTDKIITFTFDGIDITQDIIVHDNGIISFEPEVD